MNKITLNIGFFILGFMVCFVLLKVDLVALKDQISVSSSVISSFVSVLALLVAISGLYTWKYQLSHSRVYEEAANLERYLLEFLMTTVGEKSLSGNQKLLDVMAKITTCRFLLMQRDFDTELLRKIENSIRKAIKNAKDVGFINKQNYAEIHAVYTEYVEAIEKKYGAKNA